MSTEVSEVTPSPTVPRVRESIVPEASDPPVQSLIFEGERALASAQGLQDASASAPEASAKSAAEAPSHEIFHHNKIQRQIWYGVPSSSISEEECDDKVWNETTITRLKLEVR